MIDDPHLDADARAAMAGGRAVTREVRDAQGKMLMRRVEPYQLPETSMPGFVVTYEPAALIEQPERHQGAHDWHTRLIAELGQKALASRDLSAFLCEICDTLRSALGCAFGKIVSLSEDRETYHLAAASGFDPGDIPATEASSDVRSQPGYTLHVEHSVLVTDLANETRHDGPILLKDRGVKSGISTIITVGGKPWGVIGLYDVTAGRFNEDDLALLESVANIAAMTIMQATREEFLSRERIIQSLSMGVAEIGVWTIDIETGDVVWDHRFRRITGLLDANAPFDETEFGARVAPEDRAHFEQRLRATFREGEPHDLELRFFPPNRDMIWLQLRGERVQQNGRAMIVGIIADITERKQSEERSDFMMRELDHRVKNLLAIILSIAEITSRSNADIESYKADFRGRLESMARTHNLLAQTQWSRMGLRELIEEEILSFAPSEAIRVEGPSIAVTPSAAQSLAMFLHELTVNALKHGALSCDAGRIEARWSLAQENGQAGGQANTLEFTWTESGGPRVTTPMREGFGGKVINRIIKRQLDAQVHTDWHEEGIRLTAHIPLARILPESTPEFPSEPEPASEIAEQSYVADDSFRQRSVLVVDDDWLVAEQHARVFAGMGARITGPYTHAHEVSGDMMAQYDLAILGLSAQHKHEIVPLADALKDAGVPTLFMASKDASVDLPERFEDPALLFKPVTVDALIDIAAQRIARREHAAGTSA